MKKAILATAFLVSCATVPPPPPAVQDTSVVRSYVHLLHNDGGNGSGVMIAPGLMLTAGHMKNGVDEGLFVDDDKDHPITSKDIVRVDEAADIMLIKVNTQCPCTPIANVLPKIDDQITTVGYPVNHILKKQFLTEGRFQGLNKEKHRLLLTNEILPGNSGGGAFILEDGEWKLTGIVVSILALPMGFQHYPVFDVSNAVDTETINCFMNGYSCK